MRRMFLCESRHRKCPAGSGHFLAGSAVDLDGEKEQDHGGVVGVVRGGTGEPAAEVITVQTAAFKKERAEDQSAPALDEDMLPAAVQESEDDGREDDGDHDRPKRCSVGNRNAERNDAKEEFLGQRDAEEDVEDPGV